MDFLSAVPDFSVVKCDDYNKICRYCLPDEITSMADDPREASKRIFATGGVLAFERTLSACAVAARRVENNLFLFDSVCRFPIEEILAFHQLIGDLNVKHTPIINNAVRLDMAHSNAVFFCGIFASSPEDAACGVSLLPECSWWRAEQLIFCTITQLSLQFFIKPKADRDGSSSGAVVSISPVFDLSLEKEKFKATAYSLRLGSIFSALCTYNSFDELYNASLNIVLSPSSFTQLIADLTASPAPDFNDENNMSIEAPNNISTLMVSNNSNNNQIETPSLEEDIPCRQASPAPDGTPYFLLKRISRSLYRSYANKQPVMMNNTYSCAYKAWKLLATANLYGDKSVIITEKSGTWFEVYVSEPVTRFDWTKLETRRDIVETFIKLISKIMQTLKILHTERLCHTEVTLDNVFIGEHTKQIYFFGLECAMKIGDIAKFPALKPIIPSRSRKNMESQTFIAISNVDIQQTAHLFWCQPTVRRALARPWTMLRKANKYSKTIYDEVISALNDCVSID